MPRRSDTRHIPSDDAVEDALAALLANTRRIRRKLTLLQLADSIEVAAAGLGSVEAVSDRVGLSYEMLRQFLTVKKLSPKVKALITHRRIESVDMAHRLTKLPRTDQELVADAIANRGLDSDDARAIVALRKCAPNLPIREIIGRIQQTKSVKHFLILFMWPRPSVTEAALAERFATVLGKDSVIGIHNVRGVGVLTISEPGKAQLQDIAKRSGLTRKALIDRIIAGELT